MAHPHVKHHSNENVLFVVTVLLAVTPTTWISENYNDTVQPMLFGVPQGSVLGPRFHINTLTSAADAAVGHDYWVLLRHRDLAEG